MGNGFDNHRIRYNKKAALGKQLNLKVVAEGIETQVQLISLKECRCDYAQGYYLLPPVPAKEVFDFINKQPSNKAKIININK